MAEPSRVERLRADPALAPFLVRLDSGAPRRPAAPTGLLPLDQLLGGGFPRGALSELCGPGSSGRTSILLGALAGATGAGLGALVDATDGLDPRSAQAAGIALERLLWVRCGGRLEVALRSADLLVRGGGFSVVALDLGDLPSWRLGRAPAAAFVRLQRAVEGTPGALLLAGPRPVAGSLAALVVTLGSGRPRWARGGPGLLLGFDGEARLLRARDRAPGEVSLAWGLSEADPADTLRPRSPGRLRRAGGKTASPPGRPGSSGAHPEARPGRLAPAAGDRA